jgi:hypothetical protein
MQRKLFQNPASHLIAPFGGLIGIGSSAERNGFVRLDAPQIVAQQAGSVLLDVNLLLELHAVAQFHEFVGVPGIAITAAELAASVWIDGPGEGHLTVADAAV